MPSLHSTDYIAEMYMLFGVACRAVFLGIYNQTTNWRRTGHEPKVAGVISSAGAVFGISTILHIMPLLVIIIVLSVCTNHLMQLDLFRLGSAER